MFQREHEEASQQKRTLVRVMVVAAVLVVVAVVARGSWARPHEKKTSLFVGDVIQSSESHAKESNREYAELRAREDAVTYGDKCAKWFSKQTYGMDPSESASTVIHTFPASPGAVMSFVEKDGNIAKAEWNGKNLNKIGNWRSLIGAHSWKHKFVQLNPTRRLILYPDNKVVMIDTHNCQLTGLYGSTQSGEVHPMVEEAVMNNKDVMTDSKKKNTCNQHTVATCLSTAARPGMVCRSNASPLHPLEYEAPYTSRHRAHCPDGWTPEGWSPQKGVVFIRRKCGCGVACTPSLSCDNLSSMGTCQIKRNVCAVDTRLQTKLAQSDKVLSTINKVVKVTSSVVALAGAISGIGPIFGAGAGLVAAVFGSTVNSPPKPTPEDYYNELKGVLEDFSKDVSLCFEIVLIKATQQDIVDKLNVVMSRLNPHVLNLETVDNRITRIWDPNHQICEELGQNFKGLLNQADADRVLPLAPRVMEYCIANYLGHIGDLNNQSKPIPISLVTQMQTMCKAVYETVTAVRKSFLDKYSTREECGFYKADYRLLMGKLNFIDNQVIAPVKMLAGNFITV